jgi:tRNA (mo5U34)-methyltransferase
MSSPVTVDLEARVRDLGPWFHDLDLHGVHTAPAHPLGDFLNDLWAVVEPAFPSDLSGKEVLDIGCNAGFYSLRLHARGARVTGIEVDSRYLAQARFAAEVLGADIEYLQMDVYDVHHLGRSFDYVLFMGVLYHLRYPLLALDRISGIVRERLIFQSLVRGSPEVAPVRADYPMEEESAFWDPGFPQLYFIEHSFAGDPSNWWIPNRAAVEAMLRSANFRVDARMGEQVYYCSPSTGSGFGASAA